jgi:hypothetical protein
MVAQVNPGGSVHACCANWIQEDPGRYGRITDRPLREVWNSERAREFRRSILDGSYRYCKLDNCALYRDPGSDIRRYGGGGGAAVLAQFLRDEQAPIEPVDLIGHPGEDMGQALNHGATTVISGVVGVGLLAARNRTLEAGFEGVPGEAGEWSCDFGTSLTVGDFDGDGYGDLAIGAPFENDFGLTDIGAVAVLYGSLFADGFESANASYWSSYVP